MSEKLKIMRAVECFDESYGVDGDGLCEGEVAYEAELSWPFSLLGVFERVAAEFREARDMKRIGGRRSSPLRAQKRARSAMGGERGKPA